VRTWLKWTLGALGAVVLLALIALAFFWPSLKIMMGSGAIGGKEAPIPRPAASLPPLEKGAADWPCWRGPRGDGQSAVTGLRTDWSAGLPRLWEVN
jgi:hypothetical protein